MIPNVENTYNKAVDNNNRQNRLKSNLKNLYEESQLN